MLASPVQARAVVPLTGGRGWWRTRAPAPRRACAPAAPSGWSARRRGCCPATSGAGAVRGRAGGPAPAPPPALQPALKMVQWLQTKVSRHTVQRLLANTHHVGFKQSSYTVEHQQIRQGTSVKFRYVIDCKRCLSLCLYILTRSTWTIEPQYLDNLYHFIPNISEYNT